MKTLKTTTALVAGLAALSPAILPFSALAQDSNTAAAECIAKAVADGTRWRRRKPIARPTRQMPMAPPKLRQAPIRRMPTRR